MNDDLSIDRLARLLARVSGRRLVFRLAGAALVALVGHAEPAVAACVRLNQRCKKRGKRLKCCGGARCRGTKCRCTGRKIPCEGQCIRAECCRHRDCPGKQRCQNGTCGECEPGTSRSCYGGPPGTLNQGVCQAGQQTCGQDRLWGECEDEVRPTPEICDGLDNDCDGVEDGGNVCNPELVSVVVDDQIMVGHAVQGTVSLDYPAVTATTVELEVDNPSSAEVTPSTTVPAGQHSGTFMVSGLEEGSVRLTATLNGKSVHTDFDVVAQT